MTWGYWGDEPPCEHLLALRDFLVAQQMGVWSEHGEPNGWVNVSCERCQRTYETTLREPFTDEDEEVDDLEE